MAEISSENSIKNQSDVEKKSAAGGDSDLELNLGPANQDLEVDIQESKAGDKSDKSVLKLDSESKTMGSNGEDQSLWAQKSIAPGEVVRNNKDEKRNSPKESLSARKNHSHDQSPTHPKKKTPKMGVLLSTEGTAIVNDELSLDDAPNVNVIGETEGHDEADETENIKSASTSSKEDKPSLKNQQFISGHEEAETELESVPLTRKQKDHLARVLKAAEEKNLPLLRELSRQGFVNNNARRKVWPLLLGIDVTNLVAAEEAATEGKKLSHSYEDQVEKDVQRSMFHFDITKKFIENYRESSRKALSRIINSVFEENPNFHYTQGFHDITSVFYIVCGEKLGKAMTESLSKRHIRDSLRPNLEVIQMILTLIFPLINLEDEDVFKFLSRSNVQPYFALSWVLTWYSHNIENFGAVTRLYDFFIASRPLMPLYFSVAVIISLREKLFKVQCDYPHVHQFFQNFSGETINLSEAIEEAWRLSEKYPPLRLYKEFGFEPPDDSPLWVTSPGDLSQLRARWRPKEIWDPRGIKFWTHLAFPVGFAILVFYISSSRGDKKIING